MKLFLVAASLSLALLVQAEVMAKAPDIQVEVVALDDTTKVHVQESLFLSTPAGTALHVQAGPMPESMVRVEYSSEPPGYDYRYAKKVERQYKRHRRYYRRRSRNETSDLRQANLQKARKFEREQRKKHREQPPNTRLLLNSDPRRRPSEVMQRDSIQ